jgi:hypothetical protein
MSHGHRLILFLCGLLAVALHLFLFAVATPDTTIPLLFALCAHVLVALSWLQAYLYFSGETGLGPFIVFGINLAAPVVAWFLQKIPLSQSGSIWPWP